MTEKLVADAATKMTQTTERGVETFVRKAWSIMDAASEKRQPSEFMTERGVRAMQGKE